nr:hypothetical protein [Pseudomonas aeruginosa]
MAYFTGTANNPADLLAKLRVHAESLGWVTDRASASEWLCHNADGYWSFNAGSNQWQLAGNTGFDDGLAWNAQPGNSVQNNPYSSKEATIAQLSAGPFTRYHLFATAAYLHLHVEIAAGQFRPVMIGSLNKRGVGYTGGQYVCGSFLYSSGQALTNNWSSHPFDGYHIRYSGGRQHAAARQPRRWPIAGVVAVRLHNEPPSASCRSRSRKLQRSVSPRRWADRRECERAEQLDHPCALRNLCVRRSAALAVRGRGAGLRAVQHGLPRAWRSAGGRQRHLARVPAAPARNRHRLRPHQRMGRLLLSDGRVMATFPGFQVPKPVEGIVAGITPNIDALELNQDISLAAVAASTWAGAYAAHQPVEVIHSSYQAVHQSALEENYYNRLWLIPTTMELGNVVSTQVRPASVWNAYFSPRTLTAINREAADGITLSGQASPPLGFAALEERTWTVSIGTDGPPVVNARIVWRLQGEPDLVLVITGNRIIAWTFAPDWGDSIVERLSASTNILQSESAVTQRRAMRLAPRREFEANMYAVDRERQLLDMTLFGWGARIWALPIWPDIQLLQQPLAAGSLSIPCDTVGLDFRDGGPRRCCAARTPFNYEGRRGQGR